MYRRHYIHCEHSPSHLTFVIKCPKIYWQNGKAKKSVGIEIGLRFARKEIHSLLDQYELYMAQLKELDLEIETLLEDIPGAKEMLVIKGLGVTTVATFFAEVGDVSNYHHPQQIKNMAGLSLREHSSGKFKGETKITKRGRKKL